MYIYRRICTCLYYMYIASEQRMHLGSQFNFSRLDLSTSTASCLSFQFFFFFSFDFFCLEREIQKTSKIFCVVILVILLFFGFYFVSLDCWQVEYKLKPRRDPFSFTILFRSIFLFVPFYLFSLVSFSLFLCFRVGFACSFCSFVLLVRLISGNFFYLSRWLIPGCEHLPLFRQFLKIEQHVAKEDLHSLPTFVFSPRISLLFDRSWHDYFSAFARTSVQGVAWFLLFIFSFFIYVSMSWEKPFKIERKTRASSLKLRDKKY